jgi:hypothetical protein
VALPAIPVEVALPVEGKAPTVLTGGPFAIPQQIVHADERGKHDLVAPHLEVNITFTAITTPMSITMM